MQKIAAEQDQLAQQAKARTPDPYADSNNSQNDTSQTKGDD